MDKSDYIGRLNTMVSTRALNAAATAGRTLQDDQRPMLWSLKHNHHKPAKVILSKNQNKNGNQLKVEKLAKLSDLSHPHLF